MFCEEDLKCEICDIGDEFDFWGVIDDMLLSDVFCVIVDKEEFFFGVFYLFDVVNKGFNYKSEEEDKKIYEFEISLVLFLEFKMVLWEWYRDSLFFLCFVVGVCVKLINNEVCVFEIEIDIKLDLVGDLVFFRVNGVRKGIFFVY